MIFGVRGRSRSVDERLEALAGAGGVVDGKVLRATDIATRAVNVRIRDGWMSHAGPGLYVIEHARDDLTPAALLQARHPRTVAAGRIGAWLYGMDGYDRISELPRDAVDHPDH